MKMQHEGNCPTGEGGNDLRDAPLLEILLPNMGFFSGEDNILLEFETRKDRENGNW